jgi:hypothetical protein
MNLTKRIAPAILVIGVGSMIFSVGLGVAAFVGDLRQGSVKTDAVPMTVYLIWIGIVLAIGFWLNCFNLMRTAQFLGRWGIWPAALLSLLNLESVRSLHWAALHWPGFLIWFAPLAILSLVLGAREMQQTMMTMPS